MTPKGHDLLPVVRADRLVELPAEHAWLVQGLWARAGVGILGGAPKCCKSWLALDLALSVASHTPCLSTFAVQDPGGVLLYMAEDSTAVIKARLGGLCAHRGLRLASIPIDVITAPCLRIDREHDQARLARTARSVRPRLLVLDPFVRLHRVNENDAGQVSGVLAYLRALQRELDLAVLVVHHARKQAGSTGQAGQSLRGSGDLHAWGDSNLYLKRLRATLILTIEHRAAKAPDPIALQLVSDPSDETTHLALVDRSVQEPPSGVLELDQAILAALAHAAQPLGRASLRALVRVRNERLGEALARLAARGAIVRAADRFSVPVPPSTEMRERNGFRS